MPGPGALGQRRLALDPLFIQLSSSPATRGTSDHPHEKIPPPGRAPSSSATGLSTGTPPADTKPGLCACASGATSGSGATGALSRHAMRNSLVATAERPRRTNQSVSRLSADKEPPTTPTSSGTHRRRLQTAGRPLEDAVSNNEVRDRFSQPPEPTPISTRTS